MLLTITMEASMAYHVVECTTHGMPGASGIPEHEYTLKLVDTALTVILMFTLILHKNFGSPKIVKFWLLSLFCLAMSEESVIGMILPDATYMKLAYALTHSLWHLALFHVAYLLAKA
jgi:K+-sensing histidine kinase KdpD